MAGTACCNEILCNPRIGRCSCCRSGDCRCGFVDGECRRADDLIVTTLVIGNSDGCCASVNIIAICNGIFRCRNYHAAVLDGNSRLTCTSAVCVCALRQDDGSRYFLLGNRA